MAFYQQNAGNIPPRNGTAPSRDHYPTSGPVYQPAGLAPSNSNPGSTQPSDGFSAQPNPMVVNVSFGEHDALGGALMRVSQADGYGVYGPFPRAGTWEEPGAAMQALRLVRLAPSTSAHPGLAQATGAGPTMVFVAPPVFSVQSRPIYAVGL